MQFTDIFDEMVEKRASDETKVKSTEKEDKK